MISNLIMVNSELQEKKKKVVDFILFPVVFQPGKEMLGWTWE